MKKIIICFMFVILFVGCFERTIESADQQNVTFQLLKSSSIDVAEAICRVTSNDMDTIQIDLSVSSTLISGVIPKVPYGNDRLFEIFCYNSSGILNYSGSTIADISSFSPVINITLYPVENEATVIINGIFADQEETDEKIVFSANYNGNYDIYIMDTDGSNVERLTSHFQDEQCPNISPDKARIAFQRASGDGLGPYGYIMDLETREIEFLPFSDTLRPHYINWHPSGNKLLFRSTEGIGKTSDIFAYDLVADRLDTLIVSDGREWMPYYTPDGNSILYASDTSGIFRSYIANADGSNIRMINPGLDCEEKSPEMSPVDHNLVVYASRRMNGEYIGQYDLFITDLSDHSIRRVTSTPDAGEIGPCWSPDGSKIYYYRNYYGSYGIYCVEVATGNITKIRDIEGSEMYLHCR